MSFLTPGQPRRLYQSERTSINQSMYLFIYCWLIAQSTAQGHLWAFYKFKFRTHVEYNTKHAHYINVKHTNLIRKEVPSV